MHQQNPRQHDAESAISIWTVVPVGCLILLVIGVVVGGILKSAHFGPDIGDIVSFDAPAASFDRAAIVATMTDPVGRRCVLRPELMANGGGSLVVEGHESGGTSPFRVHWAGPRTSEGPEDCGRSAELLVAPSDLLALATTAGGFGVTHKRLMMSAAAMSGSADLAE